MTTPLRPLGSRVVVRPLEEPEVRTASGIVVPESAKKKPTRGKVIAVGPGDWDLAVLGVAGPTFTTYVNRPMELSVGDVVLFDRYSGTEFKDDEGPYVVLAQREVLAVETPV